MLNKSFFIVIILLSFAIGCGKQDSARPVSDKNAKTAAITQTAKAETDINSINEENNTQTQEEEDEEENIPKYIKEIRKLFESGKYNIYNNDDLKKIADKLTTQQLLDLGKDIERDDYDYIFIHINKSEYTEEELDELYDELRVEFFFTPMRDRSTPYAALFFYEKAAEQGNTEAQYMLTLNPRTDRDIEWLKNTFEKNFPDAVKRIVGLCLSKDDSFQCGEDSRGRIDYMSEFIPLDGEHCTKYIEDAYKQNLAKPYHLAVHYYYNVKDYKKAIPYINKSLEYFKTPHQDDESTYKYFDDEYNNDKYTYTDYDNSYWQSIINYLAGNLHYYGYGYPQDYKKALEYYKKAVKYVKYSYSSYMLNDANIKTAYMYKYGLGTKRDLDKSKEYMKNIDCYCDYTEYIGNNKEYKDLCINKSDNAI